MGLPNLFSKYLIGVLLLWATVCSAQKDITTIPHKLKINTVPVAPAIGDMMVTVDINGNIKKDTIHTGGGSSANGVNGLTGTGNIGLGGTLNGNTTINTGGFTWNFNNGTNGQDILRLQSSSSNVTTFDVAGNIHANGLAMLSSPLNGLIDLSGGRVSVIRNVANGVGAFAVVQKNTASTGHIIDLESLGYTMFSLGYDGQVIHTPLTRAVAGTAFEYKMTGGLKPTANGDLLVGMEIQPTFGVSTISGIGTLVGGTGYPNGTQNAIVSGGTGRQCVLQCTISGGVVTGVSIIDGGINYTPGDVLSIVITDSNGNPIGSGGSVTVSSITSYTGVTKYALRTWGVDEYGTDVSAQFDANSKVSKFYVDNRVISNGYSSTGSTTTTFTVTIGVTMPNNTYRVQIQPTSALAETASYVTNKTTTTFDVVFSTPLTGVVSFDYSVFR